MSARNVHKCSLISVETIVEENLKVKTKTNNNISSKTEKPTAAGFGGDKQGDSRRDSTPRPTGVCGAQDLKEATERR